MRFCGCARFLWNKSLGMNLGRLPVFKKKGRADKIRFPQGFKRENRRIFLPKIGWMGFHKSREIEGENSFRKHEAALAREQRKMSGKQKGSENRKSQFEFVCLHCGYGQHADVNAAISILTVGQTGMACGSNRSGGRQQEPAGTREEVLPVAS